MQPQVTQTSCRRRELHPGPRLVQSILVHVRSLLRSTIPASAVSLLGRLSQGSRPRRAFCNVATRWLAIPASQSSVLVSLSRYRGTYGSSGSGREGLNGRVVV